ncbi:ImmA/IrrE family metallo-endopeptidase [Gracilibacillus marinus]|uniref:ImmA/IrrE family metallo-endopeptidase n=1 Tax=Gracilibacillus marinus TaxID=630535 RepID=A0ABV8VX43_9BACI
MNLYNYTTTALEDWVTDLYLRRKIVLPRDINPEKIGIIFGIYIHYKPLPTRYDIFGRYKAININKHQESNLQKEEFLHELGHILRHSGHQTMMSDAFRELQEWDARNFTLYAALPHHMIKNYNLDDPYIIDQLSYDFCVTPTLCKTRLDKIKSNIIISQSTKNNSKRGMRNDRRKIMYG